MKLSVANAKLVVCVIVGAMVMVAIGCEEERVQAGEGSTGKDNAMTSNATTDAARGSAKLPFEGSFHTNYQGTQSVLKLQQSGTTVGGKIDEAIVDGKADGNTARGDVKDPQTNRVGGTFVMTRKGDDVELVLTLRDPDSGQTLELPTLTYKHGEPTPVSVQLDPQLVGRWRYTETYVSGDFTAATDTWLILNPDGTFEYGYSKGGAGSMAGSVITDRGDASTGKWRVENRVLMYQESGTAAWQPFARYYVEGDTMMLTFDNGNKKIWNRR